MNRKKTSTSRHFIVLVASPSQIERTKLTLARLDAKLVKDRSSVDCYSITHPSLGLLDLSLHLLSNLDSVTPHLRQYPVDLLIYDERQGAPEAVGAFASLKEDVEYLAKLWGPDFHFPLSRAVAILDNREDTSHRTFLLGREHVQDVLVAPKSLAQTLRWIARILSAKHSTTSNKAGCAFSGGGMEGFLYQTGCAYALEQALSGRNLKDCDVFSGISSGSILSAALAGNVPIGEMIKSLHGQSDLIPQLTGRDLYDVAFTDIASRMLKQSLGWSGADPVKWAQKAIKSIPTGFFKGEKLKDFVRETLMEFGSQDEFKKLTSELFIGATNQDTFEHVVFGTDDWSDIKISDAVRASCALPPFFTPANVNGNFFIDGMITRSSNLELVIKRDCDLVIIIDPMLPHVSMQPGEVDKKGGVYTLIQTVKTLVNSRFHLALDHLTTKYHNVDFLIFQPYEDCARAMAGSPMKFKVPTQLAELAYKGTLQRLRERHSIYSVKLEKYGFHLASQRKLLSLERAGFDFLKGQGPSE